MKHDPIYHHRPVISPGLASFLAGVLAGVVFCMLAVLILEALT